MLHFQLMNYMTMMRPDAVAVVDVLCCVCEWQNHAITSLSDVPCPNSCYYI